MRSSPHRAPPSGLPAAGRYGGVLCGGGSGCGESGSLPTEELEPLNEQDLPASLQRDLDAYRKGLAENVSYLDCLWCELYGSINSAQWSGEISEDQARGLREKYLF